MESICSWSLLETAKRIQKKEISPVEVTEAVLSNIEKRNEEANVYISICDKEAMGEAKKAEEEIIEGNYRGPLHGIPISVKDNISVAGLLTTNGAREELAVREGKDANVVSRLRAAGSIMMGKTNLDEVANHTTGENTTYGYVKNPVKAGYTSGGSSSGSAASVAMGLAYGSLGTDTAGSVRIPASCCGVVGLKPTYHALPMDGVTPLSWTMDHVGLFTKNMDDASLLYDALTPGKRATDWRGIALSAVSPETLVVGVPENYFFEEVEDEVKTLIWQHIKELERAGAVILPVRLHTLQHYMEAHYAIIASEAGYVFEQQNELKKGLSKPNARYLNHGLHISKTDYHKALQIKRAFTRELDGVFKTVDVMLTPTLPIIPPKNDTKTIRWGKVEEDVLYTMVRNTAPFNISGFPALSMNAGYSEGGLPIGMQLIGDKYKELNLLRVGKYLSTW